MCVAIACPSVLPSKDILLAAEEANPDGGGAAWLQDGSVAWAKNLTALGIHALITSGKLKAPALIHFRIETVGGKLPELCHPFPISKSASTELTGRASGALIHNGHWGGWPAKALGVALKHDKKVPGGYWSDSRTLAYMAYHLGEDVLRLVEHQKIATLNRSGDIRMFGFFIEKEGIHYSNTIWDSKLLRASDYEWEGGGCLDSEADRRKYWPWRDKGGRGRSGYIPYDGKKLFGPDTTTAAYSCSEGLGTRRELVTITKEEGDYLRKVTGKIGTVLTENEKADILKRHREKSKEEEEKLRAEDAAWDEVMMTDPVKAGELIKAGLPLEEIVEYLRADSSKLAVV